MFRKDGIGLGLQQLGATSAGPHTPQRAHVRRLAAAMVAGARGRWHAPNRSHRVWSCRVREARASNEVWRFDTETSCGAGQPHSVPGRRSAQLSAFFCPDAALPTRRLEVASNSGTIPLERHTPRKLPGIAIETARRASAVRPVAWKSPSCCRVAELGRLHRSFTWKGVPSDGRDRAVDIARSVQGIPKAGRVFRPRSTCSRAARPYPLISPAASSFSANCANRTKVGRGRSLHAGGWRAPQLWES
jgi:hypothetical protein